MGYFRIVGLGSFRIIYFWLILLGLYLIPISTLFNLHYSLYLTFVTFSYINILGFLSFIVFLSQLSSGILSSIYYNDFFTIASDPIITIIIKFSDFL